MMPTDRAKMLEVSTALADIADTMDRRDPMLEISTALADLADTMDRRDAQASEAIKQAVQAAAAEISSPLADLLAAIEKTGPETARTIAAVQAAAAEISSPLTDLLMAIEKSGPETAKTIAAVLSGMRQEQPAVSVTVPVPEVNVTLPTAAGWRFEVDYHPNGAIKGLTAKRLK
jgi:ABC-type transporter Mla subunit MlaD